MSARAIVAAAGEHVLGLLGSDVERRHATVGGVTKLVESGGIKVAAGSTTRVHGGEIDEVGGRAEKGT